MNPTHQADAQKHGQLSGILPATGWFLLFIGAFIILSSFAFAWRKHAVLSELYPRGYQLVETAAGTTVNGVSPEIPFNQNGEIVPWVTLIAAGGTTVLMLLIFSLLPALNPAQVLGLKLFNLKQLLPWLAATAAYFALSEVLQTFDLFKDISVMNEIRSCKSMFLPVFSAVIIAPVFEELLFRGMLFGGIKNSALGGMGAVVITALLFAVVHMQYKLPLVLLIIPIGIILGLARLKTGSVFASVLLHSLFNASSLILTYIQMG